VGGREGRREGRERKGEGSGEEEEGVAKEGGRDVITIVIKVLLSGGLCDCGCELKASLWKQEARKSQS